MEAAEEGTPPQDPKSPPSRSPPPELNRSPSPTLPPDEEALTHPPETARSPPTEEAQMSQSLSPELTIPQQSDELPESQVYAGTGFEVKIHKSPSGRYSDNSSPASSRDFPQLEDSCVDRILAATIANNPELKGSDLEDLGPVGTESPQVERVWEPVRNHEVPLSARYRVHDRHSCRICHSNRSHASYGTSSSYIPSNRSSLSKLEPTESLKKCTDCFNRYPWYLETCPHCEVKVSLARAPDSRYKQKVMQWCTN
jgi:hypothetical protein